MSTPADTATVSHTPGARASFEPSPVDILVVRAMLTKAAPLPFELANRVIEFAEYWACSHTSIAYSQPAHFGQDANKLLVGHLPLALLPHR